MFQGFSYQKRETDTVLKINADLVLRLHTGGTLTANVCSAWYLYFDETECAPQPIGRIVSNMETSNLVNNEHRSCERK